MVQVILLSHLLTDVYSLATTEMLHRALLKLWNRYSDSVTFCAVIMVQLGLTCLQPGLTLHLVFYNIATNAYSSQCMYKCATCSKNKWLTLINWNGSPQLQLGLIFVLAYLPLWHDGGRLLKVPMRLEYPEFSPFLFIKLWGAQVIDHRLTYPGSHI